MTSEPMNTRFRGFLPVVVDLETGGFNADTDAVLEIAAVLLRFDGDRLVPTEVVHQHVVPFPGANLESASLEVTGIDPYHPLRGAVPERDAFTAVFRAVRTAIKAAGCNRAILVAHNAAFDQQFINQAVARIGIKRNPFHPFSFIDTASLSAVAFGHTVLSRACELASIGFDAREAHSALYDAQKAAELFCHVVNRWQSLGGWPP